MKNKPDLSPKQQPVFAPAHDQQTVKMDIVRRGYWTAQMDEANVFMHKIMACPVEECGEPMMSLVEAARTAGVEVLFSDRLHVEGLPRLFYLRQNLVPQFLAAAQEMNEQNWVMKVEDGYRTIEMQRGLGRQEQLFMAVYRKVCWECGKAIPPIGLLFDRLAALIANTPKVGTHMSGSAMDISVFWRDSGKEVDRGGGYLEMSELTPMESPFVSAAAHENRRKITSLMSRHGFTAYPWEFWHYNAGDAYAEELNFSGKMARYGAVHLDLKNGCVYPSEDPTALLNSEEDIRKIMEDVLAAAFQE